MNNKKFTYQKSRTLTAIISAILFSAISYAGTRDGGGGVGVRCPNPQGGTNLELLDLYEGRSRGLTFPYSPVSDPEISDFAGKTVAAQFWNPWTIPMPQYISTLKTQVFDGFLNGSGFKNDGTGKYVLITYTNNLPLSTDIGSYSIGTGCQLEQVAYFDDDRSTIFIAKPNWDELSGLNKAAIMIHELIYAEFRSDGLEYAGTGQGGPISSERSRQFVSSMLSIQGLMPKASGVPATNAVNCYDTKEDDQHQTSYFVYDSNLNEVTFVLMYTNGLFTPFSATAKVSGITTQDLLSPSAKNLDQTVAISFDGELSAPHFGLELIMVPGQNPAVVISRNLNGSPFVIGNAESLQCHVGNSSNSPVVSAPVVNPNP